MEGKNNSPRSFPSTAEEPCGRNESNPLPRSSPGYFSTVIPPASTVIARNLSHSDLCWTLNKQRTEGRSADCKSQGSPTKRQSNKDGYPSEYTDSSYFSSSVNYGARDFYTGTSSTKTTKTSEKFSQYKPDEGADPSNIHVADRGEWWQGSLYY